MVTWSGSFVTSVSNVSFIFFSNSGIIFVFQTWIGFSPLVLMIENLVTSLSSASRLGALIILLFSCRPWGDWLFFLCHHFWVPNCSCDSWYRRWFDSARSLVSLLSNDDPNLWYQRFIHNWLRQNFSQFILLIWSSNFHFPTPIRNCYVRRLISRCSGFCFYWVSQWKPVLVRPFSLAYCA